MADPTPTTNRPTRIAVAKYAPFAFLAAKVVFIGVVALAWVAEGRIDWMAVVLALAMLMPIVITWINRQTVCAQQAEIADLRRDLRTARRVQL